MKHVSKSWHCKTLSQLENVIEEILAYCSNKKLAFSGELGAGKTTAIQVICKYLKIESAVNSPTFTILNEYNGKCKVYHFDFYRLNNPEELFELGYEEYFFNDDYVFIEWPEKISSLIPDFFTEIKISVNHDKSRNFTINE